MSIKLRPLNHVIQNQITLSPKLSPQDKYSKSGIFKMLNKGTRREDKYCLLSEELLHVRQFGW